MYTRIRVCTFLFVLFVSLYLNKYIYPKIKDDGHRENFKPRKSKS
jgi:hypothetical protein